VAFRSFQTRIVVSFLILITLVQVGTVIAVYSAIQRSARTHVKGELVTAAKVVTRLFDARNQRLVEAARILLSADFAFKQVVALGDRNTLLSAMDNHRTRMGADLMMVVSLDGSRVIDTLHRDGAAGGGRLVGVTRLVDAARQAGETADFMIVDDHPYQVVIVPLLAPVPIAWIGMGFQIDGALAQELAKTTSAQVSFVRAQDDRRWAGIASTLSPAAQQSLLDTLSRDAAGGRPRVAFELSDSDVETLVVPLPSSIGAGIHVALQRSLADAMAPYQRLRTILLGLFVVTACVSIVGGAWIARGVSRPVRQLADAARQIEAGAYQGVALNQQDELGALAATFNRMTSAVAEREERLRESEERFRAMTESAVDAVVTAGSNGTIVSWNRGAQTIFGYGPHEVLGTTLDRLIPERYRQAPPGGLVAMASTDAGNVTPAPIEFHGVRKDGREFPIELSLATWKTRHGTFLTAIIRDVTERTQLEAQFRQAQKMESIGRLAGGVAHDFNNLLTVIGGQTELVRMRLPADDPLRERVGVVQDAAARAADLTKQLLAFSRKQVLEPKILDLNTVVEGVAPMLRRLIGEDIELLTRLGPGLGHVEADPGQITQIIVNLAVNARDAMPGGGRLTIETDNVDLDETYADRRAPDVRPGPFIMLAVGDTGIGMDEEIQSHVFEPFFTTKESGKGTGLGLATVYGIVKQSNGHVGVYSEPGKGTTFKIYLPRVAQPADALAPDAGVMPGGGSETILLVEDDDRVRALACEVLGEHGYTVLEARHGSDALDISQRYHGAIQLLLTDVVMPGMGGRELAGRLRRDRPQMKILYMSGYTADTIAHHGVLDEGEAFLSKPVLPRMLASKVRETIDGPRGGTPS